MSTASPVTPGEERIRLLYRMRAHPLFWRMLVRQGIDPAGKWWHGIEHMIAQATAKCGECTHANACRGWLDRDPPGRRTPNFCPNARIVEASRIISSPVVVDGNTELLTLSELLADPVIGQIMAADGVELEQLRRLVTRA